VVSNDHCNESPSFWRSCCLLVVFPRAPKSLARRRFMEILAEGWSLCAACKEVGISRLEDRIKVKVVDRTALILDPPHLEERHGPTKGWHREGRATPGALIDERDFAQIPVRGRTGPDRRSGR